MTRSRDFSIRLLKSCFDIADLDKIFKDGVDKELVINNSDEKGYKIKSNINRVWWSEYFNIENLYNTTNSFLYFLKVKDKVFMFSFGYGYTKIDESVFEERFGFKVTLNALDSNKIKSMDLFNPSNNTKQKRIVSSILTNIYDCDYNDDNDFVENVSGVVKEKYANIFKNPTGRDSLKISTTYSKCELTKLADTLLNLYLSDDYKKDELFKDINKIKKATKEETENINAEFDKVLAIGGDDKIFISDKDIIDPEDFFCYKLADNELEISNITFKDVQDVIGNISVDELKKNYIKVLKNPDDKYPKMWRVFDCLVYDLEYNKRHFYLSKGVWYEIEDDFIKIVEKNFLNHLDETIKFQDFTNEHSDSSLKIGDEFYKEGEGHYNYKISLSNNSLKLFDKKTIKLKNNSTLEICDLYDIDNKIFYHIKNGKKTPGLSHLWNQGLNSEEVCRIGDNKEYNEFFSEYGGIPKDRKICYGIISKNKDISIFAKISFYNTIKNFKLFEMDENIKVFFINDTTTNKKRKKDNENL